MRLLALFGTLILLASCASSTNYYTQTVQSWHDGSTKSLVKAWGTPNEQIISSNGHTLYIYRTRGYSASTESNSPQIGVHYAANGRPIIIMQPNTNMTGTRNTLELPCTVLFEANASGKIIDSQQQGAGCYGDATFAAKMGNPGK